MVLVDITRNKGMPKLGMHHVYTCITGDNAKKDMINEDGAREWERSAPPSLSAPKGEWKHSRHPDGVEKNRIISEICHVLRGRCRVLFNLRNKTREVREET